MTKYYVDNSGEFPNEVFVRFSRARAEQFLIRFARSNEELTKTAKTANVYTMDESVEDKKLVKHLDKNGHVITYSFTHFIYTYFKQLFKKSQLFFKIKKRFELYNEIGSEGFATLIRNEKSNKNPFRMVRS
jgi:hypothetical protein